MSHPGSSPEAVKQKGNSTNEQAKKNKLFLVKKHGKVEVKQRGKDGKLRPLNRPGKCGNCSKHGPDGSATSPENFSANNQNKGHLPLIESKRNERVAEVSGEDYEFRLSARGTAAHMDHIERELLRNIGTKNGFGETDIPPTHHTPTEPKGAGDGAGKYRGDFVFHLSAREVAAERDRAERELAEGRRHQRQSYHPASPHPGPTHPSPHQGSYNPGFQREQLRGQSKHHPGSQNTGPHGGLAEKERAERERRRGESNHPDPQSMSPRAARGPHDRPHRGA